MLSLVAMTSAPLAGYANADLTNNVEEAINALTDKGLSIENGVFISTGAPVELSIGELVKGKYELKTSTRDSNVKLSVVVGGSEVEFVDGVFEVAAAGNVVIKAESTDGKGFKVGGFELTHLYDYDSAAKELRDQLTAITSKLNKDYYDNDKEAQDLKVQASEIAKEIEKLESTDNDVRYTAYKDLELYNGVENCTLVGEISSLGESVDTLVAKAEAAQNANNAVAALETELAGVKAELDAATDYAKGKLTDEYERIAGEVTKYKEDIAKAYEDGSATDSYTDAKIKEFTDRVDGEIKTLSSNIKEANLDDAAYNEVAPMIEAAKAKYTEALAELRKSLPGNPDVYEDLYKEAQTILAGAMNKIVAAETGNGTAGEHDKAKDTKEANIANVNEANAAIAKTLNDYKKKAGDLQNAYSTAKKQIKEQLQDRLDQDKKNIEEAGYGDKYKSDIDNVQGLIDELSAKIEEANRQHTVDQIAGTDLYTDINTVKQAIQKLEEKAAADLANYKAWKQMDAEVASLNDALKAAKELVNALKSEDEKYSVNGKYAGVEDAIQAAIDEYKAGADEAKNNGKAVEYQTANSGKGSEISTSIADYSKNANTALDNYNKVAAALKDLNKAFEELNGKVKNPSVVSSAKTTVEGKTYGEKQEGINKAITGIGNAIDAALGMKDKEHYDAMMALKLDDVNNLISDAKKLYNYYGTDESSYNYQNALAAAEALSEEADRLIKELRDKIDALQETTEAELGSKYESLQKELTDLEDAVNTVDKARPTEKPNASNATEIMASLKTVVDEIGKINKKYEVVEQAINDAKKNIADNNKNKKAADGLLKEIEGKLNIAEFTFGTSGQLDDVTPSNDFKQRLSGLRDELDKIKTDIQNSYANETLSTEWEGERVDNEPFKTILENKKAEANELLDKAKAEKANYVAYQDLKKAFDTIAGNIAKEQTEIEAVLPEKGAGYEYYMNVVLGKDCKDEAEKIKTDIEDAYKGYVTVEEKESLNGRITALNDKIKKQSELAKANEDAHNEQVAEGKTVMDEWSKAYADISANDMSSKKDSLLTELAGYQDELIALNNSVKNDWGKGESVDNGAMEAYDVISGKIKTLLDSQKDNYDAVIGADNAERYNKFVNEAKLTQDIYIAAVNTLAKLTNTVNPEYAKKISDIIAGNENIYDYSLKIRELKDSAKKSYKETESPELWDSEELNKKKAKELGEGITAALDNLIEKIYAEAKGLLDAKLPDAESKLNAAIEELKEQKYSEDVVDGAFEDVKTLINNVKQEKDSEFTDNKDYVLAADNMLSELDKVDSMIAAGQQDAAAEEWNAAISAKREQIKAEREKLEKYVENGNLDASELEAYDKLVAETVDKAEEQANSAEDLYASLPEIKKLLEQFDADNKYTELVNSAAADEANEKAYSEMGTQIADAQDALDALVEYAKKYYIYNDCVSTINNLQSRIDNLKKDAESAHEAGSAVKEQDSIMEEAGKAMKAVESAKKMIDLLESNSLKKEILNLRNLNAEVNGNDTNAFDAMEATIDGLEDRVSDIVLEPTGEAKQTALIGMEKEIAAVLTDLETAKNANAVADVLTALEKAIGDVDTAYQSEQTVLGDCHEPVKEKYGSALDSVKEKIAAVKAEIATCGEDKTLLLYNDNINRTIEALAAELAGLSQNIKDAEAPYVANDAAYKRLNDTIAELTAQKTAVENTINGYRYEVKNSETVKSDLDAIAELINAAQESVDNSYAEIKLDENSTVPGIDDITGKLDRVAKYAANSEASLAIADLKKAIADVKAAIDGNNYSADTEKMLYETYSSLLKGIESLDTYRRDSYDKGYVSKDINGDELLDEEGKPVSSDNVDFISEAVPAINGKIAEIDAAVKSLGETAESQSFIPGDINRDGSVMVDDYGTILNVVLEKVTIEEGTVDFLAADINGDGRMNIGDLSAIAQIIRGSYNASAKAKTRRAPAATNDAVSLSVEGEGTKQRIAINLQNSMTYTGCQMDIKLPAGITVASESLGSRAVGYTLSSNDLDNGAHRIVLSSLDDVVFADGSDAIVYIDVEVAHSYSGEGIEVSNIMFTDSSARVYNFADIAGNETTGIGTVTVGDVIKSKIYSVSGKLMDGLKRGVNIIRGNDGSTKKIIVK